MLDLACALGAIVAIVLLLVVGFIVAIATVDWLIDSELQKQSWWSYIKYVLKPGPSDW